MKIIIFLAVLASQTVVAATTKSSNSNSANIPADAVLLSTRTDAGANYYENKAAAQFDCKQRLFSMLSQIKETANTQYSVQYACKKVIITKNVEYYDYKYGTFDTDYKMQLNASIYCVPRSLREKQIISAQRNCEQQPTAQCWDPNYLAALESVKNTEFAEIGDSCN